MSAPPTADPVHNSAVGRWRPELSGNRDAACRSLGRGSRLPLLACYADLEESTPFAGRRVLVLLHLFRNLLDLMGAFELAGFDPARTLIACKGYEYPAKDSVAATLREAGYRLMPADGVELLSPEALLDGAKGDIVVIEDGGHFTPRILQDPALANRCAGVVEQTTIGIRRIEEASSRLGRDIPFPVVSVPHSRLKQRVEPPHIGDAAVRAVQCVLVHTAIRNYASAVLGVGAIGYAVAEALAAQKAPVTFFDTNPETLLVAHTNLSGRAAGSAPEAVAGAKFVFGASGRQSVGADLIGHLRDGVWLISVSSESVEFDLAYLKHASSPPPSPILRSEFGECIHNGEVVGTRYVVDGKVINVLNDGKPVTFRFAQMGDEVADLILTLIFLGAVDLAHGRFRGRAGILTDAIDEIARRHEVAGRYLKLLGISR